MFPLPLLVVAEARQRLKSMLSARTTPLRSELQLLKGYNRQKCALQVAQKVRSARRLPRLFTRRFGLPFS